MQRLSFFINHVVIPLAILGILAAIIIPVFKRFKETERPASCQSNLKQIALGYKQYIQDYDELYPRATNNVANNASSDNWVRQLEPYLKSTRIFKCPSDQEAPDNGISYAYNARLSKQNETTIPKSHLIILNFEVISDPDGWTQTGRGPEAITASTRHLEGANYSFADGHVKWFKPGKVGALPPDRGMPTFIPSAKVKR